MLHDLAKNAAIIETLSISSGCPLPYRNANGELDAFEISYPEFGGHVNTSGQPLLELNEFLTYLSTPEGKASYLRTQFDNPYAAFLDNDTPHDQIKQTVANFTCSTNGNSTSITVTWNRYKNNFVLIGEALPQTHPSFTTYPVEVTEESVQNILQEEFKMENNLYKTLGLAQCTITTPALLLQGTPALKQKVTQAASTPAKTPIEVPTIGRYRACALLAPSQESERIFQHLHKAGYRTKMTEAENGWTAANLWNAQGHQDPSLFAAYLDKGVLIFDDQVRDTPAVSISNKEVRPSPKGDMLGIYAVRDFITQPLRRKMVVSALADNPLNLGHHLQIISSTVINRLTQAIKTCQTAELLELFQAEPWLTDIEHPTRGDASSALIEKTLLTCADLPTAKAYYDSVLIDSESPLPLAIDFAECLTSAFDRDPMIAALAANRRDIPRLLEGGAAAPNRFLEVIAVTALHHPKPKSRMHSLGVALAAHITPLTWSPQTLDSLAPYRKQLEAGIEEYLKDTGAEIGKNTVKLLRDLATAAIKQQSQQHQISPSGQNNH